MSCDNTVPCPCTYDCPRHGKCCACVAHHRDHDEGVPGCFFSREAEAAYDRSIEALCRDRGIMLAPSGKQGVTCEQYPEDGVHYWWFHRERRCLRPQVREGRMAGSLYGY